MSDLIKKLEEYFATTPREKVLENWEKSKGWDKVGTTVDEFLENNRVTKTWIELDQIAGDVLNSMRKDAPESSHLFSTSSQSLRDLIIAGIQIGIQYAKSENNTRRS